MSQLTTVDFTGSVCPHESLRGSGPDILWKYFLHYISLHVLSLWFMSCLRQWVKIELVGSYWTSYSPSSGHMHILEAASHWHSKRKFTLSVRQVGAHHPSTQKNKGINHWSLADMNQWGGCSGYRPSQYLEDASSCQSVWIIVITLSSRVWNQSPD